MRNVSRETFTGDEMPQSNTEQYAARVDAHLPTLADDAARRAFLRAEEAKWVGRYEAFQSRILSGLPTFSGETAYDYVLTIAEITGRLALLQKEPAHV